MSNHPQKSGSLCSGMSGSLYPGIGGSLYPGILILPATPLLLLKKIIDFMLNPFKDFN
jgi:hypothetical protein